MPPKLSTIGYETATQAAVIDRLKSAGVELVVDVRAVASSRKAGFSKSLLAGSLAEAGIGYLHLRQLGTPKEGREAARSGDIAKMHAIFNDHMEEPAAQLELANATELAGQKRIALLCYEDDACGCHRSILSAQIRDKIGCEVVDL